MSNKTSAFQQNNPQPDALNSLIVDAMQDNKGKDIVLFDMRHLEEASSDFFVLCHGTSNTQMAGILKNVERRVNDEFGLRPNYSEGTPGNWLLLDYFSVVVHVFSAEKREFYNLDDLWSDAKITRYDD
ncbi:MAG: ribosome silencing factor [Aureispira sp.]